MCFQKLSNPTPQPNAQEAPPSSSNDGFSLNHHATFQDELSEVAYLGIISYLPLVVTVPLLQPKNGQKK